MQHADTRLQSGAAAPSPLLLIGSAQIQNDWQTADWVSDLEAEVLVTLCVFCHGADNATWAKRGTPKSTPRWLEKC